jgi:PKD repeat protein
LLDLIRSLRSRPRRSQKSRGQSFVELALILPAFLFIVLMGIDFGRAFAGYVTIQQSARVGANYLSINADKYGTTKWNQTLATAKLLVKKDAATADCTIADSDITADLPAGNATGSPAQVDVTCMFGVATPIISAVLGKTVPISATAVFPVRTALVFGVTSNQPPLPVALFSCTPTSGTAALLVTCTDQTLSTYDVTAWSWDFGDGTTSTDQNVAHTYATACPFPSYTCTVSLTVTNVTGTSAPVTQNITVSPAVTGPVAAFTCQEYNSSYPTACAAGTGPLTVHFNPDSSTGTAPLTYSWTFYGSGQTSTLQYPTFTYNTSGTYTVGLIVHNAAGDSTETTHTVIITSNACQVPNLVGLSFRSSTWNSVVQTPWNTAGFTTYVIASPGSITGGNHLTKTQTPYAAGSQQSCNATITVTWQ